MTDLKPAAREMLAALYLAEAGLDILRLNMPTEEATALRKAHEAVTAAIKTAIAAGISEPIPSSRLDTLHNERKGLLEQAALEEQAGPRAEAAEAALRQWDTLNGPEYRALLAQVTP